MDSRFGSLVGSELLELYSGFQSPGFRILVRQGKISRILKYRFPYLRWGEGDGGEEGGRWTRIHASGVLDFLLDRTTLWVGGLRKVGINLQLRHIGLHVQECRKNSWTEISGHQILVWSPSLLVWSCFAWFITLCIHNRIETRLTYRNSSEKAKTGKESYFCSVLFLSPN